MTESARHGAPMMIVRGGENRDLEAIAAMGQLRASQFRFRLDRDADLITHAIAQKRLLAGLTPSGNPPAGVRHCRRRDHRHRVHRDECHRPAHGLIEECGDRDVTGARAWVRSFRR